MKKLLILLLIPMFLLGKTYVKDSRVFTGALEIVDHSFSASDTIYVYLPKMDTSIDTNYFGDIDTVLEFQYPFPSVFDQHSQEGISDSLDLGVAWHTFDRWAMEDWAFAFFIEELNVAADIDSVTIDIQYSHVPAIAWTVPYNLCTDQDVNANLLTFYPRDLYDNWKLYLHDRLSIAALSDSVRVRGWLVFRQMYFHENVRPGE